MANLLAEENDNMNDLTLVIVCVRGVIMDNLAAKNRERAAARLLESIKIRCKKCKSVMVRVYDIWDESYVGYSCKDCPHYYLFTQ